MENLKLDDRVIYNSPYDTKHGKKGTIIDTASCGMYKVRLVNNTVQYWYTSRTELIPKTDPKLKGNQYSFHISSITEIDMELILNDLSRKNPIAFLDLENFKDVTYVFLHHSVLDKAAALKIGAPGEDVKLESISETSLQKSIWIDWVKTVRQAQWPDALKDKTKVIITQPKI